MKHKNYAALFSKSMREVGALIVERYDPDLCISVEFALVHTLENELFYADYLWFEMRDQCDFTK